ncbi:hypothetical protein D3C81_1039930 [compost metagenome]
MQRPARRLARTSRLPCHRTTAPAHRRARAGAPQRPGTRDSRRRGGAGRCRRAVRRQPDPGRWRAAGGAPLFRQPGPADRGNLPGGEAAGHGRCRRRPGRAQQLPVHGHVAAQRQRQPAGGPQQRRQRVRPHFRQPGAAPAGNRVRARAAPLRHPAAAGDAGDDRAGAGGQHPAAAPDHRHPAVHHRPGGGPVAGAAAGDPQHHPGQGRAAHGPGRSDRAPPQRHREPRLDGRAVHRQDRHPDPWRGAAGRRAGCHRQSRRRRAAPGLAECPSAERPAQPAGRGDRCRRRQAAERLPQDRRNPLRLHPQAPQRAGPRGRRRPAADHHQGCPGQRAGGLQLGAQRLAG